MSSSTSNAGEEKAESPTVRHGIFPDTAWSAILDGRGEGAGKTVDALRRLALDYWRPLYLYLRKRGENHEDAADSVQAFFEFVYSSDFLSHVDREGGKFRSYLLKSLERHRSRRQQHERAQKRGGRAVHVVLEGTDELEAVAGLTEVATPELAYDRQWAFDIVRRATEQLKEDYDRRNRGQWFVVLRSALPGGGKLPPAADLGRELGATEGAVRKAVFDLRTAFAAMLRTEIRSTVRTNEEAEEELRYLVSIIADH